MRASVRFRIATAVALVAACHSVWAEVSGPMRSLPLSVLTSDAVRERLDSIHVQTAGIIRGPLLSFGCGEWQFDWFGRDGRPIPGLGEKVRALYRQAGCQMTPEASDSASFVREHYVGPASEFVPVPFLTRYRGVAHNQGRLHADDYAAIPPGAERVALMSVCRWKGECKEVLVVSFSAISNEDLREVALEEAVFHVLDYRRDNVASLPHRSMEERTATVIEARDLDIRQDNTGLGAKIGAVGGTHTGWHAGSHSGGTSGGLAGGQSAPLSVAWY